MDAYKLAWCSGRRFLDVLKEASMLTSGCDVVTVDGRTLW